MKSFSKTPGKSHHRHTGPSHNGKIASVRKELSSFLYSWRRGLVGLPSFLLLGVFLVSCQTHMSSLDTTDGTTSIYVGDEAEIFSATYFSLNSVFPNEPIADIDGPIRGFMVSRRVLVDYYDTMVRVFPVRGTDDKGDEHHGYYFEVSGKGTLANGPAKDRQVIEKLRQQLGELAPPVEISNIIRAEYRLERERWRLSETDSGSETQSTSSDLSLAERLRRLDALREDGLISESEYTQRRSEILDEI